MRKLLLFGLLLCAAALPASAVLPTSSDHRSGASSGWAPAYDHEFTKKIVQLQLANACPAAAIANWTCGPCALSPGVMNVTNFINASGWGKPGHGAEGYVAYDSVHKRIIVSFRGSHNLANDLADADFWLIPSPYGDCNSGTAGGGNGGGMETPLPLPTFPPQVQTTTKKTAAGNKKAGEDKKATGYQGPTFNTQCMIEQGFYEVYQDLQLSVRAAVWALLEKHRHQVNVTVTGHSLGASVATNCAMDLLDWIPKKRRGQEEARGGKMMNNKKKSNTTTLAGGQVDTLVTMGSPRVGNRPFALWAMKQLERHQVRSVRLVHNSDIVPKLPLQSMGYLHIGNEVWYPYGHEGQTSNKTASHFLLKAERELYKTCSGQYKTETHRYVGEDPQCSNSVILQDSLPSDHMEIMGIALSC